MRTLEAMRALGELDAFGNALVVSGVGRAAFGASQVWGSRNITFDSLGSPAPIALGLRMSLDIEDAPMVVSIEGDGSILFGLESLMSFAGVSPEARHGLVAIVLDNGMYESAGRMPIKGKPVDWAMLINSFGLPFARSAATDELESAVQEALGGFLILEVVDDDAMPSPDYANTGSEALVVFREMIQAITGRRLTTPAEKY